MTSWEHRDEGLGREFVASRLRFMGYLLAEVRNVAPPDMRYAHIRDDGEGHQVWEMARVWSRSQSMSSRVSRPTEMRTMSGVMPAATCCSSLSCRCVVEAG